MLRAFWIINNGAIKLKNICLLKYKKRLIQNFIRQKLGRFFGSCKDEALSLFFFGYLFLIKFMSYNRNMIKVDIVKMEEAHIPSIMEIESVSFGKYHWSENSFRTEVNNKLAHYFVVLDETKKLVGYFGFWNIMEEGHITTFAVREEYRGQKIAEQMMQFLMNSALELEVKWFTLEVRTSNLPAINLYKKYGFETIGVREKYYQDNNEDALIMWTQNVFSDKFREMLADLKAQLEVK